MSEIIGRVAELRSAQGFLDAAQAGLAVLTLEGEAGIGKSALWEEIVRRASARAMLVLACRPSVGETGLTLAALADLLEPIGEDALARLPDPQRRAIQVALLRTEPTPGGVEQRLLGTGVRTLLAQLAAEQPLLVAIDDVQWLDGSSGATIRFALRRLAASPIGLLVARRRGEADPLRVAELAGPTAITRVEVGPLSLAGLHHVIKESLATTPTRSTLVRIHRASHGNPLFAIEIVRLLANVGVPPVGEPLPVPTGVHDLVRQRIARLPDTTREVLLAASIAAHAPMAIVRAALGRDVEPDVDVARSQGIARLDGGSIVFDHPLYSAAILADASARERRGVHGRLALVVDGPEERARHEALASIGPNASVAEALDEAARAAVGRGAPNAAVELIELSIRMTPPTDRVAWADRSIALGGYLQRSGDFTRAQSVLEEVIATAPAGPTRARARLDLAGILFDVDAGSSASALAQAAIHDAGSDAESLARAHATLAAVLYEDRGAMVHHAHEAKRILEALTDPDPHVASQVLGTYVAIELGRGRSIPDEIVQRALELERMAPMPSVSDRTSAALGAVLNYRDDFVGARAFLEATHAAALEEGDEGSMAYALSHLPTLELSTGHWSRADELANRHLQVALELGLEGQRLQALFNLALVHAHQGRESEARAEIAALVEGAERSEDLWSLSNGLGVLGALDLALGDPAAAVPPLLRATDARDAIADPRPRRHEADLVESLVAIGHLDRAASLVAAMSVRAADYGSHSWMAQAARAAGILAAASGDLDAAVMRLDEALAEHELAPIPFDRARTLLALGLVRRRRRERTAAKAAIDAALQIFEELGACLWTARARTEHDRIGLRRASAFELTEGERRVAELAASGMTNREVAAALFMSPKTVEANLARAYRKLGVSSRAGLGAVMADTEPRGRVPQAESTPRPARRPDAAKVGNRPMHRGQAPP